MTAPATKTAPAETRQRVLDAAEKVFARDGISRATVRQITTEAGVNVAAVNYHFGSREGLIEAVFERHASEVNADRNRGLDEVLLAAGDGRPRLTGILEAYLGAPLERLARREEDPVPFGQLLSQLFSEPPEIVEPLMRRHFAPTTERFLEAIASSLPDLPRSEVEFRFRFVIASLAATASRKHDLRWLSTTETSDTTMNPKEDMQRLTAFLAGGLRAPSGVSS